MKRRIASIVLNHPVSRKALRYDQIAATRYMGMWFCAFYSSAAALIISNMWSFLGRIQSSNQVEPHVDAPQCVRSDSVWDW